MNANDGGPAFPITPPLDPGGGVAPGYPYPAHGMSLRDYFAAAVAAPMLASYVVKGYSPSGIAACAYEIADAMLAERAR